MKYNAIRFKDHLETNPNASIGDGWRHEDGSKTGDEGEIRLEGRVQILKGAMVREYHFNNAEVSPVKELFAARAAWVAALEGEGQHPWEVGCHHVLSQALVKAAQEAYSGMQSQEKRKMRVGMKEILDAVTKIPVGDHSDSLNFEQIFSTCQVKKLNSGVVVLKVASAPSAAMSEEVWPAFKSVDGPALSTEVVDAVCYMWRKNRKYGLPPKGSLHKELRKQWKK